MYVFITSILSQNLPPYIKENWTKNFEGDSNDFNDMGVHFTTTYGAVRKLLQEVSEDDKQKVLDFLTITGILAMR